jgi:hypothetical protein
MRQQSSGEFSVSLPLADAIACFTPEGERTWVPGWDPSYAASQMSESPGTVFTTAADGIETIWVIITIDREGGRSAYARITPGHHAGTVRVQCSEESPGQTAVVVSYDMTQLGADPSVLESYAEPGFGEMLNEWSQLIADMVARQVG